jgi:hypothetical protein
MTDWYLLLAPLFLIPVTLLLVFVGCGLPDVGTGPAGPTCIVKDLTNGNSSASTSQINVQSSDMLEVDVTYAGAQGFLLNVSYTGPKGPFNSNPLPNITLTSGKGTTTFTVSQIATSGTFWLQAQALVASQSGSTFPNPGPTAPTITVTVE